MEVVLIIGGSVFFVTVIVFYFNLRKTKHLARELNFFKREREYNDEAMIMFRKDDKIIYANYAAKEMFLLNKKNEVAAIGKRIDLKLPHQEPEEFFGLIKNMGTLNEAEFRLEYASLIVSGKTKKVDIFVDKSRWQSDELITCVVDATYKKEPSVSEESKLGAIDFLTGLPTQFSALNDINRLIIECKEKSEFFGLFIIGIDDFENIQNTFGLAYTNKILQTMGHYFIDNPEENVTVYRMEHDKFLMQIMHLDEEDIAHKLARKTILMISNMFKNYNEVRMTASIGIALYPDDGPNASKLIDNGYIALNKAQKQGESHIEMFTLENKAELSDEIDMNEEIKNGLAKKEFVLHYQPIFDLDGEIMIGVEALLRWNHPKQGLLSADKFLDVARKTGLIADLGEYVFEEAIKERQRCSQWVRDSFQITINLSLKEMQIRNLLSRLEGLFKKYNVARDTINLDISEADAMENIDRTLNDLETLQEFGLSISLEHFGTGYSSLKYLGELPIEMIKIDRSLISGLSTSLEHQQIVKAMIDLGHNFGYKVVAEGVETSDEAGILNRLTCDFAQGYLYSKPLPSDELEGLLN